MTDSTEVSAETSTRVCTHMNEDHAVSVYAMAKSLLPGKKKITDFKLKKVTLKGCEISAVSCQGELCEMHKLFYPFQPPLASAQEVRPRMVAIHHQVCAPEPTWLVTHIDALAVLIVVALLGYGTHVIGTDNLTEMIEQAPKLNDTISMVFGSASTFSAAVKYAWIFAIVAHVGEGGYVVYHAKITLKLQTQVIVLWFLMVASVGFPITKEFLELLKVHQKQPKKTS
ncbi:expressed unknown protein [Seminavis robusta]|uniref:DUF2470 domain-containing protein n=1 Tax=Seminavis robusta TaxID=568900 RepID=A0A9N8D6R8_9STRA|nr:expressed unknown protein [Seminavis robusta]|eukprot:Sro20_g013970.1 n/a (227) ;mRNA; r:47638-48318